MAVLAGKEYGPSVVAYVCGERVQEEAGCVVGAEKL